MHPTAALRRDFVPAGGLLRVLGSTQFKQLDGRLFDRFDLATLREQTENDLRELQVEAAWLAENADRPAPDDLDPDWLAQAAEQAREKERQAAAQFHRVIAALKAALAPADDEFEAEVQQLLRDGIAVLEGWSAFYHGFHAMLARQAAERCASPRVLHARPLAGEIDYAELSREHIARYPKIRAALAE